MTKKELIEVAEKLKGKITPVDDVIIAIKISQEKSAGGIIVTENSDASKVCRRAYALAVGPGALDASSNDRQPMPCQEGDFILISGYAGLELGEAARSVIGGEVQGSKVILIRACDVLAVCD